MTHQPKTVEIELGGGQVLVVTGGELEEGENTIILQRALEIAAQRGHAGSPELRDYAKAARELGSLAKLLDRGDKLVSEVRKGSVAVNPSD